MAKKSGGGGYISDVCDSWAVKAGLCIPGSGGDTAGGGTSSAAGMTASSSSGAAGPIWTERCTASVVLFLIAFAFNLLGKLWVDPGIYQALWNAQTSWAIGGSWAAATGSPWALLSMSISIAWFVIGSMGFWERIATAALFGLNIAPLKLAITIAVLIAQIVLLAIGLRANNCMWTRGYGMLP